MKIGTVLYELSVNEPDGSLEWAEWIVRTIRGRWCYATVKVPGLTWGKRSKRHGDFGWLDPTPPFCRRKWLAVNPLRPLGGLSTTRRAAVVEAIATQKKYGDDSDYEGITNAAVIAKLEAALRRERKK